MQCNYMLLQLYVAYIKKSLGKYIFSQLYTGWHVKVVPVFKTAVSSTVVNDNDEEHTLSAAINYAHELFITLSP